MRYVDVVLLWGMVSLAVHAFRTVDDSDCRINPWPYKRNTIVEGTPLIAADVLQTSTSFLALVNGSAVIRRGTPEKPLGKLWSTDTDGSGAVALSLANGNLRLTTGDGQTVWQTSAAQSAAIAVLQDDCNFVLYEEAPLTNATWESGSQSCVIVHIVPHSHDDVGWLLTPERYYDGCHTPWGGVQSIISTVIEALTANDTRRFVQVEQYFFNRWWTRQTEATQQATIDAVRKGLFDMINGGWSMHDEACVHQESAIANMEVGAQFLRSVFGLLKNLTIGWHIDPFGHASATPRLMAQMGFDAFFFWRTDYQQRQHMLNTKTLETMWDSSPSLRNDVLMFTSIMYNGYCVGCQSSPTSGFDMCPDGFCCFSCEEEPRDAYLQRVFTPPSSRGWTAIHDVSKAFHLKKPSDGVLPLNVSAIAQQYAQYVKDYARAFRTNHVLIPYGCDFQHIYAPMSYALMDDVMGTVNANESLGVFMFYSTPERYVRAVHAMNYSWPTNSYDYFLDSDNGHSYWSGYLSSRAAYKSFERWLMNHRRAAEILFSSWAPTASFPLQWGRVQALREALGVAQHHDSITGTEREHVRNQYQNILTKGIDNVTCFYSDAFTNMTGVSGAHTCLLANLSYCPATAPLATGANVTVLVWNPLASPRREVITIPIPSPSVGAWIRVGNALKGVKGQVQPTWELTGTPDPTSPPVRAMGYELVLDVTFEAMQILEVLLIGSCGASCQPRATTSSNVVSISNDLLSVSFDTRTGYMTAITDLTTQTVTRVTADVLFYVPMTAPNEQPSGAYIFRTATPNGTATSYSNGTLQKLVMVRGAICSELRGVLNFSNAIHIQVRLCEGQSTVDYTMGIGTIESGPTGREVVLRFSTDLASTAKWYVDSQGLEVQERTRDSRPNYPYTPTELIAANFFPSNQFAYLRERRSNRSVGIIGDYTRACASLRDGELEFLAIRRLLVDDWRGVGQALNESIRVINRNRIVVASAPDALIEGVRLQSLLHSHPIIVTYSGAAYRPAPYIAGPELPTNLHLHSRFLLTPTTLILRVQHLFAVGESALYSAPVTVDLRKLVPTNAKLIDITETDLNGVTPLQEVNMRRLQFRVCNATTGRTHMGPTPMLSTLNGTQATLHPMDIRTYIATLQWP